MFGNKVTVTGVVAESNLEGYFDFFGGRISKEHMKEMCDNFNKRSEQGRINIVEDKVIFNGKIPLELDASKFYKSKSFSVGGKGESNA